jgi:hypothetical protein
VAGQESRGIDQDDVPAEAEHDRSVRNRLHRKTGACDSKRVGFLCGPSARRE